MTSALHRWSCFVFGIDECSYKDLIINSCGCMDGAQCEKRPGHCFVVFSQNVSDVNKIAVIL